MKVRRHQRFKDGSQIVELVNGGLMIVEHETPARLQPTALQQTAIPSTDPIRLPARNEGGPLECAWTMPKAARRRLHRPGLKPN